MSGFDDAGIANVGKSMDVAFAPNSKDKGLSRLMVIEQSMVCKPGEIRCGNNDEKYCGGRIGRKNKKIVRPKMLRGS